MTRQREGSRDDLGASNLESSSIAPRRSRSPTPMAGTMIQALASTPPAARRARGWRSQRKPRPAAGVAKADGGVLDRTLTAGAWAVVLVNADGKVARMVTGTVPGTNTAPRAELHAALWVAGGRPGGPPGRRWLVCPRRGRPSGERPEKSGGPGPPRGPRWGPVGPLRSTGG